jgi:hypothetical protein
MYAATTKDEANAADGSFSTACQDLTPAPDIGVNQPSYLKDIVVLIQGIENEFRSSCGRHQGKFR